MADDVAAMRRWITARICETRDLADDARAVATDLRIKRFSTPRSGLQRILKPLPRG
jgi:hypothetical protein